MLHTLLHDLNQIPVNVLSGLALACAFAAFVAQTSVSSLRRELANLTNDRVDVATGLLPHGAMPTRLEPELTWASHEDTRIGLVLFQVPGGNSDHAGAALRAIVRGGELAFRVSQNQFLVELWNVSAEGMTIAVQRLGKAIQAAGHPIVEAGIACFPDDSGDVDELVAIARANMLPLEVREPVQFEPLRRVPDSYTRFVRPVTDIALNVAIMLAALATIFVAVPFVVDIPTRPAVPSMAIAFAVSVLVSLAFVVTWNRSGARLDRSAGPRHLGLISVMVLILLNSVLFEWSIIAPEVPGSLPFLGVLIMLVAALLGVLMQGRTLVFAPAPTLLVIIGVCVAVVMLTYVPHPMVANVARVIGALAAGPLLARFIDRMSWMFLVCASIALVDVWSVYSTSGTTHQLAESRSSVLDALLLTGPRINHNIGSLGTTDAFFLAVFCAFAHRWRLDMLRTYVALALGLTAAFVSTLFSPTGIPVLPFLAMVFIVAHADRFWQDISSGFSSKPKESKEHVPQGAGVA